MKYGCCTKMDNYPILKKLGYDYIELNGSMVVAMPDLELEKTAQILEDGPIKCCGFNGSIPKEVAIVGPRFDKKIAVSYCKELCRRGNLLKIGAIGVGSPASRTIPDGFDLALADKQAREFFEILAEEAANYSISVLWESLNHLEANYGLSMIDGAKMVAELGHKNSGIVCDLYHMSLCGQGIEDVNATLPQIRHVHVSQRVGEERRYLSEEYYDFYDQIISRLVKSGYNSTISTEAFDGDVEDGARTTLQILKKIVASAK